MVSKKDGTTSPNRAQWTGDNTIDLDITRDGNIFRLKLALMLGLALVVNAFVSGRFGWTLSSFIDTSEDVFGTTGNGAIAKKDDASLISELWNTSLVHDETLPWDPSVYRKWIAYENGHGEKPPAMLVLTNLGWNQKNQTLGKQIPRHIRNKEFMIGIINHPWFHPTFWEELEEGQRTIPPNDTTRYYVFFDRPTYYDSHYPVYGGYNDNLDLADGRPKERREEWPSPRDFTRTLFRDAPGRVRLIQFNGGGWGINSYERLNGSKADWPISYIPLSDLISRVNATWDQGLVAPADKEAHLSPHQQEEIATCEAETKRKFFVTYVGNGRSGRNSKFHQVFGGARGSYFSFHDNQTVFVGPPDSKQIQESALKGLAYETILMETVFGLAPRGDNKFSYRFAEVMAAGAIPVAHADDWLWPFRPELVDWNECAVIMPEKDAGNVTLQILKEMSLEERCQRRKRCYKIYKDYMERPEGLIRGVVEGLELVATTGVKPFVGIKCSDYNYSFECNMQR
ncbi:exostosin family protein [Nitzschia inconspicua]|uniref:Exostosin family protein n=2 Tax=Nitzschia inconspicua TaxID=303405 RepID=A0A9K3Q1A0_9STRA|nr:exostosin family protein [Nitzschia inconspicua]